MDVVYLPQNRREAFEMKELSKNNENVAEEERGEEFYTLQNEACCSAEFSEGCVFSE
jgi:hypothetical protein